MSGKLKDTRVKCQVASDVMDGKLKVTSGKWQVVFKVTMTNAQR
ncbi:hypothetical protein PZA12_20920 [Clostridium beijerinckii]|nr:hypothetical protein [Clostridium sp. 2-1]